MYSVGLVRLRERLCCNNQGKVQSTHTHTHNASHRGAVYANEHTEASCVDLVSDLPARVRIRLLYSGDTRLLAVRSSAHATREVGSSLSHFGVCSAACLPASSVMLIVCR